MNQILAWFWHSLVYSLLFVSTTTPVRSQIIPDNTLGGESSLLTPNVLINGADADRIDGGAQRDSHLFHSFSQFNISNGQRVYFANRVGIQNIFTRVTGGQNSNIFGTLGVNGSANLFLLNPNGILFGPNARLDVRGAFVGTTANSFVFPEGVLFSATNPSAPPLLAINVPIGLQFGSQPGQIISQAVSRNQQGNPVDGLIVKSGSTLALIGGEITLDGSLLFAPNGQVQLTAVGGDTTVGFALDGSKLGFSVPENARLSPITFTNGSFVGTSGDGAIKLVGGQTRLNNSTLLSNNGGLISIHATQLGLDNRSIIGTATQDATKAGDIQIQASDAVTVNRSFILSNSNKLATGNGGDIAINARMIAIAGDEIAENLSSINTFTVSQGNAGNLILNATESVNVNGGSVNVMTGGVGNAGNLTVQAGNAVNVTHGGSLSLFSTGRGSTGNLRIETGTLRVQNGEPGGVRAINGGSGSVGSISIQARHAVEVIDGVIFLQVQPKGVGLAGDITIETQRVNLRDGGQVRTDTYSRANASNIVIRASESVDIRSISNDTLTGMFPSNVSSQTGYGATGNGGNVTIETPRLTLSEGGNVMTTSANNSQGNAGNITIRAKDVNLDGFINVPIERLSEQLQQPKSSLAAALSELNKGSLSFLNELNKGGWSILSQLSSEVIASDADVRGGTITVDTERLRLSNGARLDASVRGGRGQGGNLVVRATDSIEITGVGGKTADGLPVPSGLFAELQRRGIGSGGSINVETGRVNMSNDGQISVSTFNQGNGGDITIRAAQIDLSGQNIIITTAVEDEARGNAGNVSISTQGLNVRDGAQVISATLGKGNAGNLTIQANAIELTGAYSGLFSSVGTGADGKGGNLSITSDRLSIRDGGTVAASTGLGSTGQGGNVTINASEWVEVAGISNDGESFLSVRSRGEGQAGNLTVNSPRISVKDKGIINAESFTADGGNITLNTNLLLLRRGGTISATAGNQQAGGNGGNITINARAIIAVPKEDSDIRANAFLGRGGNITINTDALFGITPSRVSTSQSDITASSNLGIAGVINLTAPDNTALQNSFSELPQNSIDTNALIANSCIGRTRSKEGTFTITGFGGLPNRPGDVSASLYSTGDVRGIIPSTSTSWKKGDPIVEPTGVYRLGNGRLVMSRECV